jgi:hypothetical protein
VAAVELLVERLGADVNRRNSLGKTALHYAAMAGEAEACRRLVALGAGTDLRCRAGRTAFDEAELQGFEDSARACRSRPAVAATSSGWSTATQSATLSSSGWAWRPPSARPVAHRPRPEDAARRGV